MTDEYHDLLKADAEQGWTLYCESPSHHKIRAQCQLLGRLSMGVDALIGEVGELRRGLAELEALMQAGRFEAVEEQGEHCFVLYNAVGTGDHLEGPLINIVRQLGKDPE